MITRLEVDGFKSLSNFAVDLEPFTVFIGPNSAGKSNVLDAIALLSRLASQTIAEAFKNGRGRSRDQFTRHSGKPTNTMRFAVELLTSGDHSPGQGACQSRFRYELTIQVMILPSGAERLIARDERLRAIRREDDAWIESHRNFAEFAGYSEAGKDIFVAWGKGDPTEQGVIGLPFIDSQGRRIHPSYTTLRQLTASEVRINLERCRMLQLDAARLGEPSERIISGELAPDASNLPTVLAELLALPLGEIRADLVSLVPGIASFEVVVEGDQLRIDFELSGGERIPARLVSDGTLRMLALLTSLRLEPRAYLMGIEEPENGIYPGRLRALLELLREEVTRSDPKPVAALEGQSHSIGAVRLPAHVLPTQILLTTHSPVILAALRSQPQQLRFIDTVRRDGRRMTRVRTVEHPGSPSPAGGGSTVSLHEIDQLLHAAQSEAPE